MKIYDNDTIGESLVIGRGLTDKTFTKGRRHNISVPELGTGGDGHIEKVIYALKEAIYNATKGNSTALLLSGGKDSRLIAALMKDMGLLPTCITYIGSNQENITEYIIAKKVSEKLGFEHKGITVSKDMWFDKGNATKAVKDADGNPIYFSTVMLYSIKNQLDYDVIFSGDLMTEIMDTAEYRWYEGNIRDGLISKEIIIPLINHIDYRRVMNRMHDFYNNNSIEHIIVGRKIDRLIRYSILKKKLFNICCPAIDNNVLSETFSLPFKYRMGSRMVRNMLKKVSPELYRMPTARSPLSLQYPLWIHEIYAYMLKRGLGVKFWRNGLQNIDINKLIDIDLDFIDRDMARIYLSGERGTNMKMMAIMRLLNLKKWLELEL